MTESKPKPQRDEKGRILPGAALPVKHGLYRFQKTGKLPSIRGKKRVQGQLCKLQRALDEVVPDSDDPRKAVLIGQIVQCQGYQLLAHEYVKRVGVFRPDKFRKGLLEMQPILQQLASWMNTQRLAIAALGDARAGEKIPSPLEIAAEIDAEKAAQEAKEGQPSREGQEDNSLEGQGISSSSTDKDAPGATSRDIEPKQGQGER